ncbi:hypothetical protein PVAP13_9NG103019 [Panicum virgatum]|uniref:Uncharacterized protein n=1 Tax=Panicum virgatum TaxID=38727 RepID=A0A8T0MEA1_PANVG|nr:hypothetical protein PVAP13_9NG103019 [Panicum virgatum]
MATPQNQPEPPLFAHLFMVEGELGLGDEKGGSLYQIHSLENEICGGFGASPILLALTSCIFIFIVDCLPAAIRGFYPLFGNLLDICVVDL